VQFISRIKEACLPDRTLALSSDEAVFVDESRRLLRVVVPLNESVDVREYYPIVFVPEEVCDTTRGAGRQLHLPVSDNYIAPSFEA
ncbi:MAG: hypothetical protein ACK53W_04865, partial [Gemmatimonadota bacterium]